MKGVLFVQSHGAPFRSYPIGSVPTDSLEELGDLVEVLSLEVGDFGILGRVADGHQQHRVLVEGPPEDVPQEAHR